MPRLNQHSERYAQEDFSREIRKQQGYYDLMSQRALAEAAGIPRSTLREKLLAPDKLEVSEIRKLVKAIRPDPVILLAFLGYGKQDLKKIKNIMEESA